MKTLIIYSTKYGSTTKVVELLKKELNGDIDICNLKNEILIDLSNYQNVIIGGPVYIGKTRKEITNFINQHINSLLDKRLGLFICGVMPGVDGENQLNKVFPENLLNHSVSKAFFGGEITFKKMKFLDRLMTKMVSKADNGFPGLDENYNGSFINIDNIKSFAKIINEE